MIYLLITTCLHNKVGIINFEERKKRYIECISEAIRLCPPEIKIIIVENNGFRETYLNELIKNTNASLEYTNFNQITFKEKAEAELLDIKYIISKYNIKDDDLIIKLTGRYKLLSSHFFNTILNEEKDAYVKFFNVCTLQYMNNDCVLGLIALKSKFIKKFKYNEYNSPECQIAQYIRNNISNNNILELSLLDIECKFADNHRTLIV